MTTKANFNSNEMVPNGTSTTRTHVSDVKNSSISKSDAGSNSAPDAASEKMNKSNGTLLLESIWRGGTATYVLVCILALSGADFMTTGEVLFWTGNLFASIVLTWWANRNN